MAVNPPKLTDDQVKAIRRELLAAAKMQREIGSKQSVPRGCYQRLAETYGVSRHTIRHLQKGERYRRVR